VLDVRNIGLVFLMAVLASAVMSGLWPALFASVLSALTLNFFFLQPLYTLDIADPESVIALFFFILTISESTPDRSQGRHVWAARCRFCR
jgi:two-component system sensor histidine kinase KdpD